MGKQKISPRLQNTLANSSIFGSYDYWSNQSWNSRVKFHYSELSRNKWFKITKIKKPEYIFLNYSSKFPPLVLLVHCVVYLYKLKGSAMFTKQCCYLQNRTENYCAITAHFLCFHSSKYKVQILLSGARTLYFLDAVPFKSEPACCFCGYIM